MSSGDLIPVASNSGGGFGIAGSIVADIAIGALVASVRALRSPLATEADARLLSEAVGTVMTVRTDGADHRTSLRVVSSSALLGFHMLLGALGTSRASCANTISN